MAPLSLQPGVHYVFVLAALAGCGAHASSAAASATPLPSVATTVARRGAVAPTLRIAGVITPYREVGVSSSLAEPLTEVDVREGDRVTAGQVLARLETDDLQAQLASAERVVAENRARLSQTGYNTGAVVVQNAADVRSANAALRQAEVNFAGAQADFRRYLGLTQSGYLSEQTLAQQRTTVASDQQAVAAARAALRAAQANEAANGNGRAQGEQQAEIAAAQAAVDAAAASAAQLERQMARATIVAPTGGVVEAVNANPGEYPAGRQLFTLEENARVYAVLPASTAQAVRIVPGAAATITTNGPDAEHFAGTVEAVLDQIQPGTTNFSVKVIVPNPEYRLHAGMPVIGLVALPRIPGVVIPISAFTSDDRTAVYAVRDDIVQTVSVHEHGDNGTSAVVTGLSAGERVVTDAQSTNVAAGDRVRT